MTDPFDVEAHREAIDEHKSQRMSNPWKAGAMRHYSQAACLKFWIEQIGDAELYEEQWHRLEQEKSDSDS